MVQYFICTNVCVEIIMHLYGWSVDAARSPLCFSSFFSFVFVQVKDIYATLSVLLCFFFFLSLPSSSNDKINMSLLSDHNYHCSWRKRVCIHLHVHTHFAHSFIHTSYNNSFLITRLETAGYMIIIIYMFRFRLRCRCCCCWRWFGIYLHITIANITIHQNQRLYFV